MRPDMGKVVVERSRIGSTNRNIKSNMKFRGPNVDYDKVDETISNNKIGHKTLRGHTIGWERKELNENLKPLKKYIAANCGRPWNDVFSEISKTVPVKGILGHHIINDHLFHYVDVHTIMKDGEIYVIEKGKETAVKSRPYSRWRSIAYVHPKTGILTKYNNPRNKNDWKLPNENEKELDFCKISEGCEYRKIDGLWFEIKYTYDPGNDLVPLQKFDGFKRVNGKLEMTYKLDMVPRRILKGFQHWKDPQKRSLSKKEIKALKPENLGNYNHYVRIRQFIPQKTLETYK